jgi:hypothetical protein
MVIRRGFPVFEFFFPRYDSFVTCFEQCMGVGPRGVPLEVMDVACCSGGWI